MDAKKPYQIDEAAEAFQKKLDGEWRTCPKTGVEVRLRHPALPEYQKMISDLRTSERHRLGLVGRKADRPLPDEVTKNIFNKALVEKLLTDWRLIATKDGDLPYSPSAALAILSDPRYFEFQEDLGTVLNAMMDDDAEERETISGN